MPTNENSPVRVAIPDSGHRSMTLGRMIDIEKRIANGDHVSEDETKQYEEAKKKIKEIASNFQERYAGLVSMWQEQLAAAHAEWQPLLAELPNFFNQLQNWTRIIASRLAPVLQEAAEAIKNMPPRLRSAMLTLGEKGWYLDGDLGFSELWQLEALLNEGRIAEVDSLLSFHYEERLLDIEEFLIKKLPARERILRAAFLAHRRGEYELSIPVLLAQSDGACLDLTGYYLFIKESRKPQVAKFVDKTKNDFSAAMLSPLTLVLPINLSEKDRNQRVKDEGLESWQELNRHLVLHGESPDYGTKINSIKSISLINYLVCFLDRA